MPDYDLDDELHRLAASTRARVTPPAPQEIRMLGTRRHQRRVVMTTAAAVLSVAAAGGVAVGATRTTTAPPPPTSTTTPGPTTPSTPPVGPSTPAPAPSGSASTATPPAASTLSDAVLITAQDVDGVTGLIRIPARQATARPWRVVETGRGGKSLTPCQPAPSADPARAAAVHRRLRQASSTADGEGVSHLVEQHSTETDAQAAYKGALAWFTGCASRSIPGSTSTKKVFHQRALYGADEGQVVDVATGITSSQGEISTAAAVARVGRYVLVVTSDVRTQERYAPREDVTALMAVAVARLTGSEPARVPDDAMVQARDVTTVFGGRPVEETTISPMAGFTDRALWCDESGLDPEDPTPARPDIAASRLVHHTDVRSASVQQLTIQYTSDEAARDAVARLAPPASCAQRLTLDAGERAWAGQQTFAQFVEYGAMIQVGPAVAFVTVHVPEGDIGEVKAREAFRAVEQRMEAAYR